MKVKFVPQNIEFDILPGQSVLHVAQDHGIYVKSVCKGVPSCAECRVRVVDGEHNVLPPGSEELSLIGTGHFIDRRRLSCQLRCFGDITVDMTEQIAKQQGLIGGQKKKKLAIKDDRVEDARAIRGDEPLVDSGIESAELTEPMPDGSPDVSIEIGSAAPSQPRSAPRVIIGAKTGDRGAGPRRKIGDGENRAPGQPRAAMPGPKPERPQRIIASGGPASATGGDEDAAPTAPGQTAAPNPVPNGEPGAGQRKRRRRGGRGGRGRPPAAN